MQGVRIERWLSLILILGVTTMASQAAAQLRLEGDNAQIEFNGRSQVGFNHRFVDDSDYDKTRFFLGQQRLELEMQVFDVFRAEFDIDLRGGERGPSPRDLWIAWEPNAYFQLRVGQFKVPVSRNRLASGGKLLFAGRPAVTDQFVPSRDIGLMTTLRLGEGRYRFRAGAFVGRGQNTFDDDEHGHPLIAMRIDAAPLGVLSKGEGDVERTPGFRFAIALNGSYSRDAGPAMDGADPNPLHSIDGRKVLFGGDIVVKYRGFYFSGELLFARYYPTVGADYSAAGFLFQTAYFIDVLRVEPAVRIHSINPSDLIQDDRQMSMDFGLNFYPLRSHYLKLMIAYSHRFKDDPAPKAWKENRLRILAQVAFN